MIGFCIPFLLYSISYALTPMETIQAYEDEKGYTGWSGCNSPPEAYGTYDNLSAAMTAQTQIQAAYPNSMTEWFYSSVHSYYSWGDFGVRYLLLIKRESCSGNSSYRLLRLIWGAIIIDSDSDGLPDECDTYPNDATPYSIKTISYQTDDNTAEGNHVREVYVTDRKDTYALGADYDNTKKILYYLIQHGRIQLINAVYQLDLSDPQIPANIPQHL